MPKPKPKRSVAGCQMTMGEYRAYYECGKPAKYEITDGLRGRMFICGIHAAGLRRRKYLKTDIRPLKASPKPRRKLRKVKDD